MRLYKSVVNRVMGMGDRKPLSGGDVGTGPLSCGVLAAMHMVLVQNDKDKDNTFTKEKKEQKNKTQYNSYRSRFKFKVNK